MTIYVVCAHFPYEGYGEPEKAFTVLSEARKYVTKTWKKHNPSSKGGVWNKDRSDYGDKYSTYTIFDMEV